ncbi:hypothetical protein THAOC_27832 [Thalassiosira oceanica]|uniref:Uncharacterized protein n=1 Tax=Thalassiosira oceanica TaxID=159749 RepID=K0RKL7_THAOC|nr:hypothetical protein THAOC_27832 [Thalassiosira oceanica]|eukprot:EJK52854.1 hypothetical protein THAOC_27832 [Thalassiosira oceanica]
MAVTIAVILYADGAAIGLGRMPTVEISLLQTDFLPHDCVRPVQQVSSTTSQSKSTFERSSLSVMILQPVPPMVMTKRRKPAAVTAAQTVDGQRERGAPELW